MSEALRLGAVFPGRSGRRLKRCRYSSSGLIIEIVRMDVDDGNSDMH